MKHPAPPPDVGKSSAELKADRLVEIYGAGGTPAPGGDYYHWDKLRFLTPPEGLTREEWWLAIKLARQSTAKRLTLTSTTGELFSYSTPDPLLKMLHEIDSQARGRLGISEKVTNSDTRDQYVFSSLIEEATTSSQLEGASTTRQTAKEMIRTSRPARTRDERMILNNYLTMRRIRELTSKKLTPGVILEIQAMLTEETLDDPDAVGRYRRPDEDVKVWDKRTGTVLHIPPDARELDVRIKRLCDFANRRDDKDTFVHPVVRATILHFWLSYIHPFVDGNGRTARALFYWSMISQGYWLLEFVSISSILKRAPAQYARAFLYTESDDNDLTYFLDYHLRTILRAFKALGEYLERQTAKVREAESLLRNSAEFNHRQLALIGHAFRHPGIRYTVRSHQNVHGVANMTARTDLMNLAEKGLLEKRKSGRRWVFVVPSDVSERLKKV